MIIRHFSKRRRYIIYVGDKMNKLYMGIDLGSILAKGVIIDEYDNILASAYLYTEGNPIQAVKKVIRSMREEIDEENYRVVAIGTTGSARKLIGTFLDAVTVKNEIIAQVTGTLKLYPDARTIFEIGGQDSKIILINDGVATDYAISTLCAAGTGAFISSLAKRLNIKIEDVAKMALNSKNKVDITGRCTVFAEADLIHKIQAGYKREDIMAGVCQSIATNYVNNVLKGKKIQAPIVFNGGVSKNEAVVKAIEEMIGEKIIVNNNSHLMGAFGVAVMARDSKREQSFSFDIDEYQLETKIANCEGCNSSCSIVEIYKNNHLIDHWGNRCSRGDAVKNM